MIIWILNNVAFYVYFVLFKFEQLNQNGKKLMCKGVNYTIQIFTYYL